MHYTKTLLATHCALALCAGALLTGCNSSSDSSSSDPTALDTALAAFPASGVALPYTVLRSDLLDAATGLPFEIRNGGYGSAMTRHPSQPTQFYALTDRGPNASFNGNYGNGKKFPTPDYTPRIGLFEIFDDGTIAQLDTILLKRPDGTPITGLPNTSALGGTGETPYNADGSPVLVDPTVAYDAATNPLRLDDYGLDGEGLVALSDGTFWVSDEYGPHMVHFAADGKEIERINPFSADTRNLCDLPAEFGKRWANRGMEGLAITPDESTLVGIMQSTLDNPSSSVRGTLTRIVTVEIATCTVHQYLYRQELSKNSNSEIAALSATEFLVIERDGNFLYGGPDGAAAAKPTTMKHVYRIDLSTGTDVENITLAAGMVQDAALGLTIDGSTLEQVAIATNGWDTLATKGIVPVSKSLVVDMVNAVNFPHDKMEGLWVIDRKHLGVLNDDDFATWATSAGALEQKMLDTNTVDHNHLYIVNVNL